MKIQFTKNSLISLSGIIGYVLFLAAWVLAAVMLFNLAANYGAGTTEFVAETGVATQSTESQGQIARAAAYAITAIVTLITLVLIAVLPYYIAKYSSRFIKALIKIMKVDETRKQLFTCKLLLSLIPLAIFMTTFVVNPYITVTDIALYSATIILLVCSTLSFTVQTLLAKKLNRSYDQIL